MTEVIDWWLRWRHSVSGECRAVVHAVEVILCSHDLPVVTSLSSLLPSKFQFFVQMSLRGHIFPRNYLVVMWLMLLLLLLLHLLFLVIRAVTKIWLGLFLRRRGTLFLRRQVSGMWVSATMIWCEKWWSIGVMPLRVCSRLGVGRWRRGGLGPCMRRVLATIRIHSTVRCIVSCVVRPL